MDVPLWLEEPARRYPRLEGDQHADVCVVGAGASGLSCARVLAEAGLSVGVRSSGPTTSPGSAAVLGRPDPRLEPFSPGRFPALRAPG